MIISPFSLLILMHFVSDWFFQLDKWGANKKSNKKYLFYHSVQYAVLFIPLLYLLDISLIWTFWLFATHFFIDDRKFVGWWNIYIKRTSNLKSLPDWYPIVQDQVIHIIFLIPLLLF